MCCARQTERDFFLGCVVTVLGAVVLDQSEIDLAGVQQLAAFYSEGGETLEQDAPLLKGFSARLDGALSSLISEKCHQPQYIPSSPNHSVILTES